MASFKTNEDGTTSIVYEEAELAEAEKLIEETAKARSDQVSSDAQRAAMLTAAQAEKFRPLAEAEAAVEKTDP